MHLGLPISAGSDPASDVTWLTSTVTPVIAVMLLVGGIAALVVAGNLVVSSATFLGTRLGLSPTVVGLTIVAGGTSAPELAVSLQAAGTGDVQLAVGNILGSNTANVLLVIGIAALVRHLVVPRQVVRRDLPIVVAVSLLVYGLGRNGSLDRIEAAFLFLGLIAYVAWTLWSSSRGDTEPDEADIGATAPGQLPLVRAIGTLVAGVGLLVLGARLAVDGAERIALSLGIPELVVGLTIVALGTSAPEIVTSVVAARKGRGDLAIGNAVGSNLFNLLFVLSTSALVADGVDLAGEAISFDLPIMIGASVVLAVMAFTGAAISRWRGAALLLIYALYLTALGIGASGGATTDSPWPLLGVMAVLTVAAILLGRRSGPAEISCDVGRQPPAPAG